MNNCFTSEKFSVDINGHLHYGLLLFMLAVANLAPWFLVVFSKTIHCRLNLTIDLESIHYTTDLESHPPTTHRFRQPSASSTNPD